MAAMQGFTFVHAADLHLDSQFQGVSLELPGAEEKIRDATFQAFENLVSLCIREEVDFLLVAGDVYNQEERSLRAQLKFRDGLKRLAEQGIQSFIVHGNHDPVNSRSCGVEWPGNTHVFPADRPETVQVVKNGSILAEVSGMSHPGPRETRNLARLFDPAPGETFHIGLLHCNLKGQSGHDPYAPCEFQDLASQPVQYWALGHVHERTILSRDPWVVYPGNIQGLNIRETGERGCCLVRVDAGRNISVEFKPLSPIRWELLEVDIRDCPSFDKLEEAVLEQVHALRDSDPDTNGLFRMRVSGRGDLHERLQSDSTRQDLLWRLREVLADSAPWYGLKDIQFQTRPDLDSEQRSRRRDFLGELLRISQKLQQETNQPLLDDLAELYAHRKAGKILTDLSEAEMRELLQEAEALCIDLFEG